MRSLLTGLLTLGLSTLAYVAPAAAADPPTVETVVRPVLADGTAAPGWAVTRERGKVSCDGAAPSAVDAGIAGCYPAAAYLPSCWKSKRHTVLCVRDVRGQELVRIRYTGRFPEVTAPARPSPQALDLPAGRACDVRIGGAWGAPPQHPKWLGFYSCTKQASVYGPERSRDGIDRTGDTWRVRIWIAPGGRVVAKPVRTAYFVGTAV